MQAELFQNSITKNTLVNIQKKAKNYTGLDKYYTSVEVAKSCIKKIEIHKYDFIVEPSAGNGAFYNHLKTPNKVGLDIAPENPKIIKQDWFKYKISEHYKKVLVIGNPPFGINNTLSIEFLTHSFRFANVQTVAFILPNVFNKHTKQKLIPTTYRIAQIIPLPRNSFIYNNQTKHIPCSFFVFDKSKGKDLRFIPDAHTDTSDFYFGDKNDFDIFVFGASPKKITTSPTPNNRGYFLKSKISVDALKNKIKKMNWSGNSCANGGVFWLTKAEFCYQYKKYYYSNIEKNKGSDNWNRWIEKYLQE